MRYVLPSDTSCPGGSGVSSSAEAALEARGGRVRGLWLTDPDPDSDNLTIADCNASLDCGGATRMCMACVSPQRTVSAA